jgi:hypothetical protein
MSPCNFLPGPWQGFGRSGSLKIAAAMDSKTGRNVRNHCFVLILNDPIPFARVFKLELPCAKLGF